MINPINFLYEINFCEDEKPVLKDSIVRNGNIITAHFFDVKNNREILVEVLGECIGHDEERIKRIYEKHYAELSGTMGTLNEYKKSITEAVQDGSFVRAREKYIFKTFDVKVENDNSPLLEVALEVVYKNIYATYRKINGMKFRELLGNLVTDYRNLNEIFDEFKSEVTELFHTIKSSGIYIKNSIEDDSFMEFRERQNALKQVNAFIKALQKYLDFHCIVHKPRVMADEIDESLFKDLKKDTVDGITIIDWDISFYETLLGILYRPKYTLDIRPPCLFLDICNAYRDLRQLRASNIEKILHNPSIKEYQLFHNRSLVAIKTDGEFHIIDNELFFAALQIPSSSDMTDLLTQSITKEFIEERVTRKEIPETRVKHLEKWMGTPLWEAISKTNIQKSNVQAIMILQSDEIVKWEEHEIKLLAQIVSHLQKQGMVINEIQQPDILTEESFDNPLVLLVYKYFRDQLTLEELGLNAENALEMLDIVKLYDYALNLLNLASFKKLHYEQVSDVLKARILELVPTKKSHEVFTKTLQTKDLSYCLRHVDPSRKGLYAKTIAIMFIEAIKLSEELDHILGVRGNTGSGKSTIVPKGALNVDDLKAALKKGFLILNSQIHQEAAKVFEGLLAEIIQRLDMNYCLDARLIEPEYLNDSIILPAKERNIPAIIKDKEFPLAMSLLRVLIRPTYGKDPCPPPEAIKDGYKRIREDRGPIIAFVKDSETVTSYELFFKLGGLDVLVAEKKGKEFRVIQQDLYAECLRVPTEIEIDEIAGQILTRELILQAIDDQYIYAHQAARLVPYIGRPLAESAAIHAAGKNTVGNFV